MKKRAGKTGNRAYYKGHTCGKGGVKCPCCGAAPSKTIRRCDKQELIQELRRYAREDFD